MKNRAMGFVKVSVARDTLQLPPGLTAGMAISAEIAAAEPALVGAIGIGTEVRSGVDGAPASSGAGDDWRGRAGCLGVCLSALLTGLTQRFVDESRKGGGLWSACDEAYRACGVSEVWRWEG
jgi:hypothetical protein